jgi:hypothetical protein
LEEEMNMRIVSLIPLLAALCAGPSCGATTLAAGTYAMFAYVTKVATTGKGTCDYRVGEQYSEFFVYPGPNRLGASKKQLIQTATDHFVGIDTFPKTPGTGATSWSGTYHYSFLPAGRSGTGTFTWKLNIVDTTSFVSTRTLSAGATGDSCAVTVDESGVRTGS